MCRPYFYIQSSRFFKYPENETKMNEPQREQMYDQDIQDLLTRARNLGPILVPDALCKPHTLKSEWKSKRATETPASGKFKSKSIRGCSISSLLLRRLRPEFPYPVFGIPSPQLI